jgi:uncharacterized protein YaaQ
MLLLLAIVQSEDARNLTERLLEQGLRLTQINSTGGLLVSGSVALLLGIEEKRYDAVMHAIRATCQTRLKYISTATAPEPMFFLSAPIEVEVGGAVVFGVPVERFLRVPDDSGNPLVPAAGDATDTATGQARPVGPAEGERNAMKLIVAIVRAEDANEVIRVLLEAEHRLTRINTTGGFLRRGNATLLIGVKAEQVDEVIRLIQTSCRPRPEPAPIEQGIPEYAATVFVLDASHFVRI